MAAQPPSDDRSDAPPRSSDPRSFDRLKDAWLSAVTGAEAELQRATSRLRESFGLGDGPEGVALLDRVRKHREELERRIDEGVHAAIAKVRAPIDKELASLKARVEAVHGRLDALKRRRSEKTAK